MSAEIERNILTFIDAFCRHLYVARGAYRHERSHRETLA